MTITILSEIPEQLHTALWDYLNAHPQASQDALITLALSAFLAQHNTEAAKVYLDHLVGVNHG